MAITVTQIEVQDNNSSGASLQSGTITASCAVDDQVWVCICADNAGTSGAISIGTPTDSGGNTYALVRRQNRTDGSVANDGTSVAIYRAIVTTALASGVDTITTNYSPNTVVKGFVVYKVTGAADTWTNVHSAQGNSTSYAESASDSLGTDTMIMEVVGTETKVGSPGADSDTTNGSWVGTTFITSNNASDNQNQRARTAYKIVTGNGTQTFNGSVATTASWAVAGAWVGFKVESSFTADAVLATSGGAFTADAITLGTQSGSSAADAIIKTTVGGTFTEDAIAKRTQSATLTEDGIVLKAQTSTSPADAVLKAGEAGSFAADAVLTGVVANNGSFTADGILLRNISASLAQDAIFKAQASASLTQDAVLVRLNTGSITGDADIKGTIASSATANAVIKKAGQSFTFNADADIEFLVLHFSADAVIGSNLVGNRWQHHRLRDHFGLESDLFIGLSTRLGPWEEGTPLHFVLEDLITRMDALESSTHNVSSFTGDGIVLAPGGTVSSGGTVRSVYFADAVLKKIPSGSFTAQAFITRGGSFTANAYIRFKGTFTAYAVVV